MQGCRKNILFVAMLFAFFSCNTLLATEHNKGLQLQVALEHLKKITSTESRGDELYFSVTEYSSIERPRTYLVPNFPTHWLSEHLAELKDVVLWQKALQENESVMLVISLLERDAPPWNVDDLVGTIKLKAQFVDGKLKQSWQIPNKEEVTQIDKEAQMFAFTGENGNYEVDLKGFTP